MKKMFVLFSVIIALIAFTSPSYAQTATAGVSGVSANLTYAPVTNNTSDPALGQAALQAADNPNAYRNFAMGTPVTFGQLISHFGPRSNSGGFMSVENLLLYVSIFTEDALDQISQGKATFDSVNQFKKFPVPGKHRDARWIAIVIQERKMVKNPVTGKEELQVLRYPNAAFKGFVSAWGTKEKNKMQNVMAAGALAALRGGCNLFEINAEGAAIDTISSGWGVGFNTTAAYMPAGQNQNQSYSSTLGAGYSEGQAGMRDIPWVNGNGLVIPDAAMASMLKALPLDTWDAQPTPVLTDAKQTGNHIAPAAPK